MTRKNSAQRMLIKAKLKKNLCTVCAVFQDTLKSLLAAINLYYKGAIYYVYDFLENITFHGNLECIEHLFS